MRRTILVITVATMLAGVFAAPAGADGPDVRSLPFAFNNSGAGVLIPTAKYGEPQLALDHQDHVLICTPGGGGVNVFRSVDWTTWKTKTVVDTRGGGDCDIAVGPDNSVYIADLQLFASEIRKSIDDGQTFTYSDTEDPVEQDRQFLAPDPKDGSIVYFGYHDFVAEAIVVAKSTDGGHHFIQHTVASTDPTLAADTYPNTFQGNLAVDPTNTQNVYITFAISNLQANVATCPPTPSAPLQCPFGLPTAQIVAVSHDGGVTWTEHKTIDGGAGSIVGNLQPRVAVDSAGNVYAVSAGHIPGPDGQQMNGLFYSYSTDHGTTWSRPIDVTTGTGATVFPTIATGNDGRVDFAWLESTAASGDDKTGDWSVKFAQTQNGHDAAPTFTEVTGPVVHHGDVCVLGIGCNTGDRSLLDFMGLAVDSFGYAHMAVGDNDAGQKGILYWRQDAGPSVFSDPCPVDPGPGCVSVRPGPRP